MYMYAHTGRSVIFFKIKQHRGATKLENLFKKMSTVW